MPLLLPLLLVSFISLDNASTILHHVFGIHCKESLNRNPFTILKYVNVDFGLHVRSLSKKHDDNLNKNRIAFANTKAYFVTSRHYNVRNTLKLENYFTFIVYFTRQYMHWISLKITYIVTTLY